MQKFKHLGLDWIQVDPVHHKTTDGKVYQDEYTFTRVYIGDAREDGVELGGCLTFPWDKNVAKYQYNNETSVLVTQEGTFRHPESSRSAAENQAYFALSRLSEKGYVGRWSRQ